MGEESNSAFERRLQFLSPAEGAIIGHLEAAAFQLADRNELARPIGADPPAAAAHRVRAEGHQPDSVLGNGTVCRVAPVQRGKGRAQPRKDFLWGLPGPRESSATITIRHSAANLRDASRQSVPNAVFPHTRPRRPCSAPRSLGGRHYTTKPDLRSARQLSRPQAISFLSGPKAPSIPTRVAPEV